MTAHRIEAAPRGIETADLRQMSRRQTLIELTLPLPWFACSLWLYSGSWWFLGFPASFVFFLCCLRMNHEAIHGNLGLGRRGDGVVMHALSAAMLGSNHADAWCHLQHHRDTLGPGDKEGHCAHMSFWQVLAYGPRFPIDLNRAVWAGGGARWRRRVMMDWLCIAGFVGTVALIGMQALWLHVAAMALGQCLTALFAVWITHHDTQGTGLAGRSQRGPLAWMAYLMFYHREHHLFPNVPVSRLPVLAARLDAGVPGYAAARLPVVPGVEGASGLARFDSSIESDNPMKAT